MEGDFHLGDWLIQPSLGRATLNGHVVHVRAKVMDLLVYLAERHGEVVSRDALLDGVWGADALSESALSRTITELRHALQDDAERPGLIETVPKRGYRIIAPVRRLAAADLPARPTDRRTTATRQRNALAWAVALLAVTAASTAIAWRMFAGTDQPVDRAVTRFLLQPPDGTTFAAHSATPYPAVSPDGRRIVVTASTSDARQHLWLYSLDSISPHMLAGTDDAQLPFWSPDGHSVGFFARGRLWKVPASGGPVQPLCDAIAGFGATWNSHDEILFAPNATSGLFRVSSSGGQASPVTSLNASREEISHRYPQFLPDGRHYIFLVESRRAEQGGVYVGSLDSSESRLLTAADSNAVYVAPGYLLFVRDTVLTARPFDGRQMTFSAAAFAIVKDVPTGAYLRFAPISAAAGVLTYRTGGMHKTQLVWVDRRGRRVDAIGVPEPYLTPALSPDGTRLAVDALGRDGHAVDTWVFDLKRGISTRMTNASTVEGYPLWTRDGARLVLASARDTGWALHEQDLSDAPGRGSSRDHVLLESRWNKYPQAWSPDGQSLIYAQHGGGTGYDLDLWLLPLADQQHPRPVLATPFNETHAQLSPDGRWLAYTSDESSRLEVYIRSFPGGATKTRVSIDGGCQPRWRADGKELYYLHGGALYAVPLETSPVLNAGVPIELFETRVGHNSSVTWDYVAAPDGHRFIVKDVVYEHGGSPMVVVLNWETLLRQ